MIGIGSGARVLGAIRPVDSRLGTDSHGGHGQERDGPWSIRRDDHRVSGQTGRLVQNYTLGCQWSGDVVEGFGSGEMQVAADH